MIYADHAATTKTSETAKRAMLDAMDQFWGNPSSLHTPGQKAAEALEAARETVAGCIGAEPREIYFTSGGSEADNQAIRSAAYQGKRRGKNHIISTAIEHHAVLHTLAKLEREGFEVTLLPVDASGVVTVEAVAAAIRPETALVTVMYVNNEIGTIQPIKEIGALCRERKVIFHTDAVQAVGHLPINVKEQNIDMLSLSGHKFQGPRGTGALFVLLHRGRRSGAEQAGRHRGSSCHQGHGCCAERGLRPYGGDQPKTDCPPGPTDRGPVRNSSRRAERRPGAQNCRRMLLLLDDKGIAASSGSACTSGSLDPSHVLLAIGRPHEVAHGSLRLSLGEDNTAEDIETIIENVKEIVAYLRSISPVWKDLQKGVRTYVIQ